MSSAYFFSYAKKINNKFYQETISLVLKKLLNIIPKKFDSNLLSITNDTKNRPAIFKRTKSLKKIPLNLTNYNEFFTVKLKSINLLVNGVKRIIKLTD